MKPILQPAPPRKPARQILHLPEAAWPAPDRERFACAFDRVHDIFDDNVGGGRLKPRTRQSIRFGYRRWLGWLAACQPELLATSPELRATPETIKDFVIHLRHTCTPRTIASQVGKLNDGLRYMYPDIDWTWLKTLKTRLERAIPKAGRTPIVITSQRLFDASLERMEVVELELAAAAPDTGPKDLQALALRYRDSLLVALTAFFPLRRTNVAQLEIGSTIRRGPAGWSVHIPGDLVKNGEPAESELEGRLNERIERYVAVYRPLICRSTGHKGFWASAKGYPATGEALYNAFQKETRASLGLHLTLHDTRRIAVTTWAVHDPVNAAGARDLLGDRSERTIAQHYNLASGIEASRAMAGGVAKLKG